MIFAGLAFLAAAAAAAAGAFLNEHGSDAPWADGGLGQPGPPREVDVTVDQPDPARECRRSRNLQEATP